VIDGLDHLGAPGNPGLEEAAKRIADMAEWIDETGKALFAKWDALLAHT
jgi:hypothetical protein